MREVWTKQAQGMEYTCILSALNAYTSEGRERLSINDDLLVSYT